MAIFVLVVLAIFCALALIALTDTNYDGVLQVLFFLTLLIISALAIIFQSILISRGA
jgi:hypothetical protein